MRKTGRPRTKAAMLAVCGVVAAGGMGASCLQLSGLSTFYDCPQEGPCPDAGTGGSAPSCMTPADCPVGDECSSPVCTGGKCGLAAKDDGLACMADAGSGYQCKGGACGCPAENQCGAACVDTQSDPANCGGCGMACPQGIACAGGACACPGGGIVCGGACVDVQTDAMNCGGCGHACTVTGATCEDGACACPGGGTECSGTCVDTATDVANCGGCGMACPLTGSVCSDGNCGCLGAEVECSGACVDTNTDPKNCGACGHDCLGGECQAAMCQPVVLATGKFTEIAIDASDVYWTNSTGGSVMKVAIAGGAPTTLASGQNLPSGIDVDATNVYWGSASTTTTSPLNGTVQKIPLAGGSVTVLASGLAWGSNKVAVDSTSAYWTDNYGNLLMKVSKSGGTPVTLANTVSDGSPDDLALDATNVYWCTLNTPSKILKVSKAGGTFSSLASSQSSPSGIAVNATSVFWASAVLGAVRSVPLAGGSYATLFSNQNKPHRIAIDGNTIYWTSDGGILRAPIAGGTPVYVYTGVARALKVDATSIYFTAGPDTQLLRLAK